MTQDDEYLWERLLQGIETGNVVPILGRSSMCRRCRRSAAPSRHAMSRDCCRT
jgi:hypothetical protein